MKIDVEKRGHDITIITPHGKIVSGEKVMALKETIQKLVAEGNKKIIINFEDVPFMDSTGLGVLIASYTTMQKESGHMKLIKVTDRIKDLLTITKLVTLFDCYNSEMDAIGALVEKK